MAECGFRSVDVMLATFTRLLQTTPGAYRRPFRTSCTRQDEIDELISEGSLVLWLEAIAPSTRLKDHETPGTG